MNIILNQNPDKCLTRLKIKLKKIKLKTKIFLLLILILSQPSCKTQENPVKIKKRNFEISVWAEFLTYQEYLKIYPELKKIEVELFLAIREGENLPIDILQKMEFRAWLLLKKEKGYWISTWNASKFYKFTEEFLQKNIDTDWIILDFEPPWNLSTKVAFSKNITDFFSAITQMKPPEHIYQEGKNKIDELIYMVHSKGKKVLCVFIPFVVDDLEDGDQDISKFFGIYVPPNCDEYSFMLYTTALESLSKKFNINVNYPEYFVYNYARDIYKIFGEKSSVDIGLVGDDLFGNKGYPSPDKLKRDISAGLAAEIKKFHIWTLDNMKTDGKWDVKKWLDIEELNPIIPQEDETVIRVRDIIKILD